ncbi:hypothetical protein [Sorangium sp. So ce542]|uniref:hypothetical protein n=1 Tax=Sorangium sp. So ce542 TaxID=3133316 RepID=UPI003F5DB064
MNVSVRGTGIFLDRELFPIDDRGPGSEGRARLRFTHEIPTTFEHMNGDHLVDASDDDLRVFIDGGKAPRARRLACHEHDIGYGLLGT